MKRIPIVIPAYLPDERLLHFCEELYLNHVQDVVIVDDGSDKACFHLFEKIQNQYHYTLMHHRQNRGKGRALKTAFQYLLKSSKDVLGCITADADGQHMVKDILKCREEFLQNPYSLVLGCRDFTQKSVPWKSKFGNNLTKLALEFLCGVKVSDTQTGLRAIPMKFMRECCQIPGERFEFETNMLIESKGKYSIREVMIETVYDSKENHTTHFHPIIDSLKIYHNIFKVFFRYMISSLSASFIDIVLFAIFCAWLKSYNGEYYIWFATICARMISSIYNCFMNYRFVFHSSNQKRKVMIQYFVLVIMQMFMSAFLVNVFAKMFASTNEVWIKLVVDICIFIVNFFIQRKFIFEKE